MLAESQVSGLFLRLFGTSLKDFSRNPKIFQKNFSKIGTHGGCHVFGLFLLPFTAKNTIYSMNNEYKHKILTSEPSILGTPVGG